MFIDKLLQIFDKKQPPVQFGLSESNTQYCLVKFQEGEIETYWYDKEQCTSDFLIQQMRSLAPHFNLIRSVPHMYIWRKCMFLPKDYDEIKIYRYILQQIKHELPVSLEKIYFDYCLNFMPEQGFIQVIIYALAKTFANDLMLIPQTYLDCEWNCMQRAYHFLAEERPVDLFSAAYLVDDQFLQFKQNEIVLNKFLDHLSVYEIYTIKPLVLSEKIREVYVPLENEIKDQELFMRALGASLWEIE